MSKEGVFKEADICLPLSSSTNPSSICNPPPDCGASTTSDIARQRRSSSITASIQKHCSSSTAASKTKLPVTIAACKRKRPARDSADTTTLEKRQRRSGTQLELTQMQGGHSSLATAALSRSKEKVVIKKFHNAPVANECDYCHEHTSNHYCRHPVKGSNFTIEGEGIEICGMLACIHCKEQWEGGPEQHMNRCRLHRRR